MALVRAERPKRPTIHAARQDVSKDIIEAALCQSVGLPEIEEKCPRQLCLGRL